jgi:hypothetical protein
MEVFIFSQLERIREEVIMASSQCCPRIFFVGLRKTEKELRIVGVLAQIRIWTCQI